jgi:signal peptidase I
MTDQPAPEPKIARRRWWLAALLQILGATGSIYVGRPLRYFILIGCGASYVIGMYHGYWGALTNVWFHLVLASILIAISIYFLVDAIRLAVRQKDYQLRWYNRWWIYVGCIVAVVVMQSLIDVPSFRGNSSVRIFSLPSGSMMPSLQVGDYVLVDTTAFQSRDPNLGEIAVYRSPRNPSIDFIKRIVAGPEDRIQVKDGVVHLNGVAVKHSQIDDFTFSEHMNSTQFLERLPNGKEYRTLSLNSYGPGDNTKEFQVPAGHHFVLGDNRDNSTDSRFESVGFIPRGNFLGSVTGILWAKDLWRLGNLPQPPGS